MVEEIVNAHIEAMRDSVTNYAHLANRNLDPALGFDRTHPYAKVARVYAGDTPISLTNQFMEELDGLRTNLVERLASGELTPTDLDREMRDFVNNYHQLYSNSPDISVHTFFHFLPVDYSIRIRDLRKHGHC